MAGFRYHLSVYGALCSTEQFTINGIIADHDDFGEKYDRDPDGAEDYCCGDMQFTAVASHPDVLAKYQITEEEYQAIAEELVERLSFGSCGWCV
jgi:hypothetical protein